MEDQNPVQAQNQPLTPVQPQPVVPPVPEPVIQPTLKPPSEPKSKLSKWMIVAIVVVVLIIVGAAGAYFLNKNSAPKQTTPQTVAKPTPTSDPTANWKTYENKEFGFSFSYPPTGGLELKEYNGTEKYLKRVSWEAPQSDAFISFQIYSNPNQLAAQKWWETNFNTLYKGVVDLYAKPVDRTGFSPSYLTFNGYQFFFPVTEKFQAVSYYIANKKYVIEITATIKADNILKTFKFTEGEIATVNGLNLYTNNKLDYSFTYPADWILEEQTNSSSVDKIDVRISPPVKPCPSNVNPLKCEVAQTIIFGVKDNPKDLSIEAFIKENRGNSEEVTFTTILVGGINGMKTVNLPGVYENTNVYVKKDKKIYEIEWNRPNFAKKINETEFDQILSTFKFTNQTSLTLPTLKIPEYGVQIALSDEISDAYYINTTVSKGYVYLKVHSLDSEPQCAKDDSSTAALSRVGKDDINPMTGDKYSASFTNGKTIGNYFYYIDLAQYACAESPARKVLLEKVRTAFTNAEITQ